MPTGYTDTIKNGITFEQFALGCARAFGALIVMRDDPSDAQIPEQFEPSDYHSKALSKAREDLSAMELLTPSEWELKATAEHTESEMYRLKAITDKNSLRCHYAEMLECAKAWIPPSGDHDELKNFMIKQIEQSIDFDCDIKYYSTPTPLLTGIEWAEAAKAKALKDIEYHKTHHAEEVQRTNQRNEWVKLLRSSL